MIETDEVQAWLNQFKGSDRLLAQSLVNSLTLVSSTQLVNGLRKQIIEISDKNTGKCALIPIRKIQSKKYHKEDKEYRKQYSSADWIGYILTELEREDIKRFMAEPTVASMRAEKVNNIILVDDIIGTGKRVISFWKTLNKSIKSWISSKHCKIWLVSYVAHNTGIKSIIKQISPFRHKNIYNLILLEPNKHSLNQRLEDLCIKYGKYTSKDGASLGYGNNQNLIVFEFSCPNNSPAILWANGKRWKALFPNRAIPSILKTYFGKNEKNKQLDILFKNNQEMLALSILNAIEHRDINEEYINILFVLGLIQRGYTYTNIIKLLVFERTIVSSILRKCIKYNLIEKSKLDSTKYILTLFGADILSRYRKDYLNNNRIKKDNKEIDVYYPVQFKNIPAKI